MPLIDCILASFASYFHHVRNLRRNLCILLCRLRSVVRASLTTQRSQYHDQAYAALPHFKAGVIRVSRQLQI